MSAERGPLRATANIAPETSNARQAINPATSVGAYHEDTFGAANPSGLRLLWFWDVPEFRRAMLVRQGLGAQG